MQEKKEEIHIEEEGFITTKKGLTLSSLALFIWVLTSVLYGIINKLQIVVDYKTFCFFVSLFLSGLAGYYITKSLVKNADKVSMVILIIANILLLYTSANGIQSGYCFISSENQNVKSASLIPFIVAKPWLPDKFQSSRIDELETNNQSLRIKVQKFEEYSADNFKLINELEKLKEEKLHLLDSLGNFSDYYKLQEDVTKFKNNVEELDKLNSQLNANYAKLKGSHDKLNDTMNRLRLENERLAALNKGLNNKIEELNKTYLELKRKYNTLFNNCKDIDKLKDENTKLKRAYNKLKAEHSSLQKKFDELKKKPPVVQ